jgi:hypothetical protein
MIPQQFVPIRAWVYRSGALLNGSVSDGRDIRDPEENLHRLFLMLQNSHKSKRSTSSLSSLSSRASLIEIYSAGHYSVEEVRWHFGGTYSRGAPRARRKTY